jgi:protein involved in polysaccharide export with SLBB domain
VTDNEKMAETFTFHLRDGFVIGEKEEFFLQPYDEVVVRKSPMYEAQRKVTVAGAVNFTGEYVMLHSGYRLTDLLRDAGGLTTMAYVKGARLRRNYTEEELNQRTIQQEEVQIELYENSLKTGSDFDMERAKALMDMKQGKDNTYIVAIDLEKAMAKPGSIADVMLREGDVLDIPQFTSMIKISGEVQNPISVGYVEGKSLKYYINKAGGYSDNARKKKTYAIYMNGSTDELGRRAKRGIQPGCEIVVPARPHKERMSSSEILTIGTSAASIATMVATLVTLFK